MQVVASMPPHLAVDRIGDYARRVEDLGFDVLHVPETIHDPFVVSTIAATRTSRITIRTSMVVAFARSPMVTALAAWDLARLSGGRFELGLASQVRGNVVDRFSAPWSEPVARLRDYVASVRAIFHAFQTGEALDHQGEAYAFRRLQPYFNPGPLETPSPRVWTGGVNERMCELAGEVSDGFVCHPTSSHPRVLREVTLPALERGASRAGRAGAGPAVVTSPQPLVAASHAELARLRDARRRELAFLYSTPAYRRQLELFGLDDVGESLSAMAARSDWAGLEQALTDDVLDLVLPQGTFEDVGGELHQWYAGLCDGMVLAVPPDAEPTWRTLVERCREIPPLHHPGG